MNTLSKEIIALTKISACITLDDFKVLDKKIKEYKTKDYPVIELYECILQCYLFCGFPAAIESFKVFRKFYPDFKARSHEYDLRKYIDTGLKNCKLIYKNNYKKLIENMSGYSPELKQWMLIEGYGKVLGRKGLSLLNREYINVAILTTRFYENQLHSHLKGCMHIGASQKLMIQLLRNLTEVAGKKNVGKALMLLKGMD